MLRTNWSSLLVTSLAIVLLNSSTCNGEQYFAERPQNTTVRHGETATLRCRVANQQGKVQWTQNGLALGFERTMPSFPRYSMTGNDEKGEHHLRIENATLEDDAEYQCQVGPKGNAKPIRADAQLIVMIPPSSVEIVHYAGSQIPFKEGEEVVLQCLVRDAKPAAEIVWFKRNVELKNARLENIRIDSELARHFDVRSKLRIRAQSDDNDAEYTCEARHPVLKAPKRASISLNVQYPPGPPEIIGFTEGEAVRSGQDVRLECVSRGGNPLATVVWYRNEHKIDHTYVTSGRESRNVYAFRAEPGDNNARFRCEASNALSVAPIKAEVTLTVHFPPINVKIRVRHEKLRPGQTATLTCESDSSFPYSKLAWLRSNGQPMVALSNGTSPGTHSGLVTKSTLQMQATLDLHGQVVICQASNGIGPHIEDAITIEVLSKPQFFHPAIYTVDVVEGQPVIVNMTARANPSEVTYTWSRQESAVKADGDAGVYDRITFNGPLLNLTVVRRDDKGEYMCEATNTEGSQIAIVRLNVQYPASIVHTRSVVMVDEGSDAYLDCQAAGNPLTTATVIWRRQGFDLEERSVQSSDFGVAYLMVKQVNHSDTGVFECVADNGIGGQSTHKTWLLIKYKPVMDDSPQLRKAASDEGQRAKLICRAQGAPDISFEWSREGVSISSSDRHSFNTRQVDTVTWESTLEVANVRLFDYGQYDCIARNEMGTNRTEVILSDTSRPDPPLALRVLNVTHNSVDLEWQSGFDGGLPQAYRIRYSQVSTELYKYVDVSPANVTIFTLRGLSPETDYLLGIMAFNELGDTDFTMDDVTAKTSSPWDDENVNLSADPLLTRGESPMIIIIAVSTAGSILLILCVILVVCFLVRRRRKKCVGEAVSSEGGSSKTAPIEMYGPSSYNEAVNGEMLSSNNSDKSESHSRNDSLSDLATEDATKTAASTYMIDQQDGNVAYGFYRVSATSLPQTTGHNGGSLIRPPKTVKFDLGEDNRCGSLRRNVYSQGNDYAIYGITRLAPAPKPDASFANDPPPHNVGPYSPETSFHSGLNHSNTMNEYPVNAESSDVASPYLPMASLNIPIANGIHRTHSARVPPGLPVKLPLPLPMSMQQSHHGISGSNFTSSNPSKGPSPITAATTAHFSGPSFAKVRSLETEGHLV